MKIQILAPALLLVAGMAVAQVGGHAPDDKVISGSLTRFEDCVDVYPFFGQTDQILWADVDGSRYRHRRNRVGAEFGWGYCIEVVDPLGEPICFSDGENTFLSFFLGDGGADPALSCILPQIGNYQLRVSLIDRRCGDLFYPSCDGPVLPPRNGEEGKPFPFGYLLHVSLRGQAAETFVSSAAGTSLNRF